MMSTSVADRTIRVLAVAALMALIVTDVTTRTVRSTVISSSSEVVLSPALLAVMALCVKRLARVLAV